MPGLGPVQSRISRMPANGLGAVFVLSVQHVAHISEEASRRALLCSLALVEDALDLNAAPVGGSGSHAGHFPSRSGACG